MVILTVKQAACRFKSGCAFLLMNELILRTPASGRINTALCLTMDTAKENVCNACCVDVINHGLQETPWGTHPRISLVFETDEKDENGNPKFLTRTFNNYAYSKSALTLALKNWLGRDISGEDDDWDIAKSIEKQATLSKSQAVSKAGNHYEKIDSINPGGTVHVQVSGTYERKEWTW
jgi:hypothetical protein